MKHLLKWVIPVAVLLMIGMWIGLNWNQFPANEVVTIPVAKKETVKYDTAIRATEEPATVVIPEEDALTSTEDSINAALATMEENEPVVIAEPGPETEADEINDLPSAKEDEMIEPRTITAQQKKSTLSSRTPKVSKKVTGRIVHAEQPRAVVNRNVTPSPEATVRSVKEVQSNKKEVAATTKPKNQVVFDSYMSHKQIPVDHLVQVDGSYQPSESGKGISEGKFLVYNRSGKNIKRVKLEVQYLSKGNQLLRRLEMPVSNISADGAVSLEVPANAEADRLVYKVLYVSSALGDFYYEPLHIYANASR